MNRYVTDNLVPMILLSMITIFNVYLITGLLLNLGAAVSLGQAITLAVLEVAVVLVAYRLARRHGSGRFM